jgi:predicted NAD/FAD-dependent oxidoreductase
MFSRSALSDGQDDENDDEDPIGVVPDPVWADAQDWLYDHPEIAVVSDAVDKMCDDLDWPGDLNLDPESYASWDSGRSLLVRRKTMNRFGRKIDFA